MRPMSDGSCGGMSSSGTNSPDHNVGQAPLPAAEHDRAQRGSAPQDSGGQPGHAIAPIAAADTVDAVDDRLSQILRIQQLARLNRQVLERLDRVTVETFPAQRLTDGHWGFVVLTSRVLPDTIPDELADPEDKLKPCALVVRSPTSFLDLPNKSLAEQHMAFDGVPLPAQPPPSPKTLAAAVDFVHQSRVARPLDWPGVSIIADSAQRERTTYGCSRDEPCVRVSVKAKGWAAWGGRALPAFVTVNGHHVLIDVVEGHFVQNGQFGAVSAQKPWDTLSVGAQIAALFGTVDMQGCRQGTLGCFARAANQLTGLITAAHVVHPSPSQRQLSDTVVRLVQPSLTSSDVRSSSAADRWQQLLKQQITETTEDYLRMTDGIAGNDSTSAKAIRIVYPQSDGCEDIGDIAFVPGIQRLHAVEVACDNESLWRDWWQIFGSLDNFELEEPFKRPCFCQPPQFCRLNDTVYKFGCATGLTAGKVTTISAIVEKDTDPSPFRELSPEELKKRSARGGGCGIVFSKQILIRGFSLNSRGLFSDCGDSGSLVWKYDKRFMKMETVPAIPIGLLIGSAGGETVASPLLELLDRLQVEMATVSGCRHGAANSSKP